MSILRFQHVFWALMALAAACAFVLPEQLTDSLRRPALGIFAPVSWPSSRLARWLRPQDPPAALRDPAAPRQPRPAPEIAEENHQLRQLVSGLSAQLDKLRQREAEREKVGPVRDFCSPFDVTGVDAGAAQSLLINAPALSNVRPGQPVLYWGGIAGKISAAGASGARVQLITDRDFKRFTARFARFQASAEGQVQLVQLATDPVLVDGQGGGKLILPDLPARKIVDEAQIAVNDWLVLHDTTDWPLALQGYPVGRVVGVEAYRDKPGHVQVVVEPETDLLLLKEVWVMNR